MHGCIVKFGIRQPGNLLVNVTCLVATLKFGMHCNSIFWIAFATLQDPCVLRSLFSISDDGIFSVTDNWMFFATGRENEGAMVSCVLLPARKF